MTTFTITNLGKKYRVTMRRPGSTITSEKKLIAALTKAGTDYMVKPGYEEYGKEIIKKIEAGQILKVCAILGILGSTRPVEK
jgi:hypothetical protein